MTEERITETSTPKSNTHTHTTVITDQPRTGEAFKWIALLALIVVGIGAVLALSRVGDAEAAKDNAVADAADQFGKAAEQVGDSAEEAIDNVSK